MIRKHFHIRKKTFFLFLLFIGLFFNSFSQQILIPQKYFHIDDSLKLILINQSVSEINSNFLPPFDKIQLDDFYEFDSLVPNLEIGKKYVVKKSDNTEYFLFFTELPIIHIKSSNEIVNEPRTLADFHLITSNGEEVINKIGVEYRGGTSLGYPKKNFRIEFWADDDGNEKLDVSLLGMRSDDDWNIDALYVEPLRIRSKTANDLWLQMYEVYYQDIEPEAVCGIHSQYAEMFLNNHYLGVYLVSERIDRKQLQLKKFHYSKGIRGELYKAIDWGSATTLSDLEPYDNSSDYWSGYLYKYPEEIINWTNLYNFVDFVYNSPHSEFIENYKKYFEVNNVIDFFIFINVCQAIDNTGKNIFLAKYDKSEPYFYVPYDLDATFGSFWDGTIYYNPDEILINRLYKRLFFDCNNNGFYDLLKKRWTALRAGVANPNFILDLFMGNFNLLKNNGVYERETMALAGNYIYPENGINYIEDWLNERFVALDKFFAMPCDSQYTKTPDTNIFFSIYPNPISNQFNIDLDDDVVSVEMYIYNLDGSIVMQQYLRQKMNTINVEWLSKGIYFVVLRNKWLHGKAKILLL